MKKIIPLYLFTTLLLFGTQINRGFSQNNNLNFDGANDIIDIQTSVTLSPTDKITVEAWIKGNLSTRQNWIYDRLGSNEGFGLVVNADGTARFAINGGTAKATSVSNVLDGTWNHIAGTYDKTTGFINMYVNGVIENVVIYGNRIVYTPQPRNSIGGRGDQVGSNNFPGLIDEVRVWDVALSGSQITNNMCVRLAPSQNPSLIGYWDFREGSGTMVYDLTAHHNDGLLKNGVSWSQDSICAFVIGVNEYANQNNTLAFPVPANDFINIELVSNISSNYSVLVYNSNGSLVKEENNISTKICKIDLQGFASGLYHYRIIDDFNHFNSGTFQVVKNNQ